MPDEVPDQPTPPPPPAPPMARRVERTTDTAAPAPRRPRRDDDEPDRRRRTYDRHRTPEDQPGNGGKIIWIVLAVFGILGCIILGLAYIGANSRIDRLENENSALLFNRPRTPGAQPVNPGDAPAKLNPASHSSTRQRFRGIPGEKKQVAEGTKWFVNFNETVKDRKDYDGYNAGRLATEAISIAENSLTVKLERGLYDGQADIVVGYYQAEWRQWDLDKAKLIGVQRDDSSSAIRIIARYTVLKSGRSELVCWYLDLFDGKYQLVDWESLTYGSSGSLTVAYEILKAEKMLPRAEEYGNLFGLRSIVMQSDGVYNYQLNTALAQAARLAPTGDFALLLQHAEIRHLLSENKPKQALEVLDHVQRLQPNSLGLQLLEAEALARNEEYLKALANAKKLRAIIGDDPELLTTEGLANIGLDRIDDAQAALTKALDLDPGHYPALVAYKKTLKEDQLPKFLKRFAKFPKAEGILYKINQDFNKPEEAAFRLAVAREHHRLRPKDVQARNNLVTHLTQNKRWDELKELLGKWITPLNPQERKQLVEQIIYNSAGAKEPLTVYGVVGPHLDAKSEGFAILARQVSSRADDKAYRYSTKNNDEKDMELARTELDQLIEARAKTQSDDPWLDYFRAKLAWYRKDYAGAEKRLAKVVKLPRSRSYDDDDEERDSGYELRHFRIQLAIKLGKTAALYDDLQKQSGDEHLETLFGELEEQKDGAALLAVMDKHAKAYPGDIETNKYRALGHEFRKNFTEAVTAQKKYIDELETAETYGRWKTDQARKKYLRLLVKSGKAEEAHEYAVAQKMPVVDVVYTLAASGERDEAINRMTDEIRSGEMKVEQFYADEDLKTILMTARYEKFRTLYPYKPSAANEDE
jgi:hypothetical protein